MVKNGISLPGSISLLLVGGGADAGDAAKLISVSGDNSIGSAQGGQITRSQARSSKWIAAY